MTALLKRRDDRKPPGTNSVRVTPKNLKPVPRNPAIAKFMIQLGRFDELGSGVINVNRYLPLYAKGAVPKFREKDSIFITRLPLGDGKVRERVGKSIGDRVGEKLTENQQAILGFLKDEPTLSARVLSQLVDISVRKIETNIAHLREIGRLKRVGAARGGYWEVMGEGKHK